MAITFLQLRDEVERVVGDAHDPRLSPVRIVNDAGRYLFAMHGWRWRDRPPVTLDFVADQAYLTLPGDFGFGEIVSLAADNAVNYSVQVTTLSEVERYRAAGMDWHMGFLVALAYPGQTDASSAPATARLEIEPTPQNNRSDALRLVYRAGWVELSGNTDVANVPPAMESLLVELVRAFAVRDRTFSREPLDQLESSSFVQRLKAADGRAQANRGPMRGGMVQQPNEGHRVYATWEVNG